MSTYENQLFNLMKITLSIQYYGMLYKLYTYKFFFWKEVQRRYITRIEEQPNPFSFPSHFSYSYHIIVLKFQLSTEWR